MEYINATTDEVAAKSESDRIWRIHDRVRRVKTSEKVGVKFMQAWEEKYYDKLEAREEGLAEGESKAIIRMVCRKLRKGLSANQIAEDLEEDVTVILKYCEAANICAPDYDEEQVWEEYKKNRI